MAKTQVFDADVFIFQFFGFILGSDQQFIETLGHIIPWPVVVSPETRGRRSRPS